MWFFKQPKEKDLNICLIDDSEGSLLILEDVLEDYFKDKTQQTHIDKFRSYQDFMENKKSNYDIAIIDWNLSNSYNDRGDRIIKEINCDNISIFSGMTEDAGTITSFTIQNGNITYIKKGDVLYKEKLLEFIDRSIYAYE
jgi:response regulator RpfG family c-di-GMP phosphodiesterase